MNHHHQQRVSPAPVVFTPHIKHRKLFFFKKEDRGRSSEITCLWTRLPSLLTALLTGILLTSCASVSIDPRYSTRTPVSKPSVVFVDQFQLDANAAPGSELTEKRKQLPAQLQARIIARLKAQKIAAQPSPGEDERFLHDAWHVTGSFTKLRAGNRVMRAVVGLGAGRTQLAVNVAVDSSSGTKVDRLLEFDAAGGSGAAPGAVFAATNPVGAAVKMAGDLGPGLSADTNRAGRMIAAYIAKEMAARGSIDPKQVNSVKIKRAKTAPTEPAT